MKNEKELYKVMLKQLEALLEGEDDKISNLANASALLMETLEQVNWAGFYLIKENRLQLGPFQGKVACIRIPIGKGVCGTAVKENKTLRIEDVHEFEGHIACDSASNSEIVIPIRKDGVIVGVLDIDSPIKNRFSKEDQKGLEDFVTILENACKW